MLKKGVYLNGENKCLQQKYYKNHMFISNTNKNRELLKFFEKVYKTNTKIKLSNTQIRTCKCKVVMNKSL